MGDETESNTSNSVITCTPSTLAVGGEAANDVMSIVSSSFNSVSLANGIPEFVPRGGVQLHNVEESGDGSSQLENRQEIMYDPTASLSGYQNSDQNGLGYLVPPDGSSLNGIDGIVNSYANPESQLSSNSNVSIPAQNVAAAYYNQLNSVIVDVGSRHNTSSVVSILFDQHEQLVWEGNSVGHVSSYFGAHLRKYSSFQVHSHNPIKQLETIETGVISLTQNSLKVSQRGGLSMFDTSFYDCDLECMLMLDHSTMILGGHQGSAFVLDLNSGQLVSRIQNVHNDVVLMKYSEGGYCFGHSNGSVTFMDLATVAPIKTLSCHTGSLSDLSISGNTLITCGYSNINDQLAVDSFINVYDIRNYRLIHSYHSNIDPFIVRFFPMYTNRALVLSQMGQFQIVDPSGLAIPESLVLHKVATPSPDTVITACDVSSTSHAIVFGDSAGLLQLYGDSSEPVFNEYANPTEFPNPPSSNMYVSFDDFVSFPFSVIPFDIPPYAQSKPLLSDLPSSMMKNRYYDPPPIPQEIASKIENADFIGYAPFPAGWLRNQVPYRPQEYLEHVPESLSSRDGSPLDEETSKLYPEDLPSMYYKVASPNLVETSQDECSVSSKSSYVSSSQTCTRKYPTLENNSINGYSNMLLYAISTIEPLGSIVKSHLCKRELCITCEVSCIFDTLKKAPPEYSFVPYNFLKVFSMLPETTALGLVISEFDDNPNAANSYSKLAQNFNRFLLQQLHQDFQRDEEVSSNSMSSLSLYDKPLVDETKETANSPDTESKSSENVVSASNSVSSSLSDTINKLLGLVTEQTSVCKCGSELSRQSSNFTTPLIYPDLFNSGKGPNIYSFTQVVKYSLTNEVTTPAWCSKCLKYQPSNQKKKTTVLPQILSLNCQLDKPRDVAFWKVQQKLSRDPTSQSALSAPNTSVGMCRFGNSCTRKDCKFRHEKDIDIQSSIEKFVNSGVNDFEWAPMTMTLSNDESDDEKSETKEYELVASVLHVPAISSRGHMVARVTLGSNYYVINDTAIHQISQFDFNKFNLNWTLPCVLFYKAKDFPSALKDIPLPVPVKREFLSGEAKLIEMNPGLKKLFAPMGPNEEFTSSDYVGLDMNIVSNCKQETDINPDGTYKTITSSENSVMVTRVVCFRGGSNLKSEQQPLSSVPLFDDHHQCKETVVEYINKLPTLDMLGGKHFATFKQTFLKLKYLVEQKVIFVGHNLERKLKWFNLYVPKSQIQDTAALYKLSRHQSLPLKFLASYFGISYPRPELSRDCLVALQLYKFYLKITNEGKTMQAFRMSLQEIYNSPGAAVAKLHHDNNHLSPR